MSSFFFPGGLFQLFFLVILLIVVAMFVLVFVRTISQWNRNNHSPRLTVEATVISRRSNVSYHHHDHGVGGGAGGIHTTHSTTYYVTFQVASGDRMEFQLTGSEYGMLVEGDRGRLSFQGTRYLGFERM